MLLFYFVLVFFNALLSTGAYLIFKAPALLQFTVGISQPIKVDNHTLSHNLALQAQYNLPINSSELLDLPEVDEERNGKTRRRRECNIYSKISNTELKNVSYSGLLKDAHQAAELWLEERGLPGRKCLQAAVCAHSGKPLDSQVGLLERILHIFLTPSMDPEAEADLIEAELRGGESMEACLQYYPFCSDLYQLWTIQIEF